MRLAFLGLGRMGAPMAAHALAAGHDLTVWNRSPGKAGALVAAGAREASSVAEAVADAEVVVTMLFGPESVRGVLEEVVEAAPRGALVVDATTVGPDAAREFEGLANGAGLRFADAPVAGSVRPATDGTLGVLVGCHAEDWEQVREVVSLWGDEARVRRAGDVGAGSALKLVLNQGIGVLATGLGEALAVGSSLGLDRELLLQVLGAGPYGWVLAQKGEAVAAGDHSATAFSLALLGKDLDLVAALGGGPVTHGALEGVRAAMEDGHAEQDYGVVINHLADGG